MTEYTKTLISPSIGVQADIPVKKVTSGMGKIVLGAAASIFLVALTSRRVRKITKKILNKTVGHYSEEKETVQLDPTERATRRYMMNILLPIWIGAGFLDWYWHKKSSIETTAGTRESITHLTMLTEAGVPILAALFFEVNSGLLATMTGAWAAHEATAYYDVTYAGNHRDVTIPEIHTHTYLGVLPFCALSFMLVSHWEHVEAIFDKNKKADFTLRKKKVPLKPKAVLKIFALLTGGLAIPYLEELYRCLKAEREGFKVGSETPPHVHQRVDEYVTRKDKGLDRWF
ncbi:hypothetical protein KI659_17105 [Litoribacter alkaliphilus]|uniref:Diguanylate cyclase n=1 Tax=Litoribacter ruber TaxID=702568 RepID=A0AAP2G668_9BACT|nr:hypothetical protein [Litoribacter alkaliphilus]MBS9525741.1 hypothetical protein [Litoribacter alkaliphilus]